MCKYRGKSLRNRDHEPIVQSTFAALWSAVLVVWEAASVEAAHERAAIPQPSRRGG